MDAGRLGLGVGTAGVGENCPRPRDLRPMVTRDPEETEGCATAEFTADWVSALGEN